MLYIFQRNYLRFSGDLKKAVIRHCNSSWTNDNSPLLKSFGSFKKKNVDNFQWASVIYTWTSVQEDNQCTFLILWNVLQVSRNAILNIWTAWPLLYCRIFIITTRFSGILMTDWVKITKKYPAFPHSKTLLFQYNKICSVTRLKFVPSLIHIDWVWS